MPDGDRALPSYVMDVIDSFSESCNSTEKTAVAVLAVQALTKLIEGSKASTMMELQQELQFVVDRMQTISKGMKNDHGEKNHFMSLTSGCQMFMHFVTRTYLEVQSFETCKEKLIHRGYLFVEASSQARERISHLCERLFRDKLVVLVHGYSRVVASVLKHVASKRRCRFSVICTETRPNAAGYSMAAELREAGIPVTMVIDSAVAYVMDRVDFVLVGAEAVVENGGIVNKIGTYQVAVIANHFSTPVYVTAESYKFARLFPLHQRDLDQDEETMKTLKPLVPDAVEDMDEVAKTLVVENPGLDYTPPCLIDLLVTDIGVLTPAAVSDELIKLHS